jgi:hypothetical protein
VRSDPTKNKGRSDYATSVGKKSAHKLNRKNIKGKYNKGIDKRKYFLKKQAMNVATGSSWLQRKSGRLLCR